MAKGSCEVWVRVGGVGFIRFRFRVWGSGSQFRITYYFFEFHVGTFLNVQ